MGSHFSQNIEPVIYSIVNTISLCTAIIAFVSLVTLVSYRRQVLNRVTLRFQGLIALIDIAKHITLFDIAQPGGTACLFIGFFRFFIDHMYIFTNVLISLNIQLIYIHKWIPKPIFEMLYILAATSFALVIDLIPFAYDAYGQNFKKFCFLKDSHPHQFIFKIFLLYVSIIPGLFYCVFISIWVIVSSYKRNGYLEARFPSKQVTIFGESVNGKDFIGKLYFRMGLYPFTSVISFLPYIASNIYHDINGHVVPKGMFFTFLLCKRLTGLLNFVSLLFDPHFQIAIKSVLKYGFLDDQNQSFDTRLLELRRMKKNDEEYLINFPGDESIRFEDYIKFL